MAPMRIGILTGGENCPGLNAVIRAVTRRALDRGDEVVGILHGWRGLIDGSTRPLGEVIWSITAMRVRFVTACSMFFRIAAGSGRGNGGRGALFVRQGFLGCDVAIQSLHLGEIAVELRGFSFGGKTVFALDLGVEVRRLFLEVRLLLPQLRKVHSPLLGVICGLGVESTRCGRQPSGRFANAPSQRLRPRAKPE